MKAITFLRRLTALWCTLLMLIGPAQAASILTHTSETKRELDRLALLITEMVPEMAGAFLRTLDSTVTRDPKMDPNLRPPLEASLDRLTGSIRYMSGGSVDLYQEILIRQHYWAISVQTTNATTAGTNAAVALAAVPPSTRFPYLAIRPDLLEGVGDPVRTKGRGARFNLLVGPLSEAWDIDADLEKEEIDTTAKVKVTVFNHLDREALPYASGEVEARLTKKRGTRRIGVRWIGNGGQLNAIDMIADNPKEVLSALVDRATALAIGRMMGLPVYAAIAGGVPDSITRKAIRARFKEASVPERTRLLQRLNALGHLSGARSVESLPLFTSDLATQQYLELVESLPWSFEPFDDLRSVPAKGLMRVVFERFPKAKWEPARPALLAALTQLPNIREVRPEGGRNFVFDLQPLNKNVSVPDVRAAIAGELPRLLGRAVNTEVNGSTIYIQYEPSVDL